MQTKTQANLEEQLKERWVQVDKGNLNPQKLFDDPDEWILQLSERKALLHPNYKQWLWHDRLHDEWAFADCGVRTGILLSINGVAGVKKLPRKGSVADWCVYKQQQKLHGPIRIKELRKLYDSQEIPNNILVWSTQATDWVKINEL